MEGIYSGNNSDYKLFRGKRSLNCYKITVINNCGYNIVNSLMKPPDEWLFWINLIDLKCDIYFKLSVGSRLWINSYGTKQEGLVVGSG